MSDTHTVLYAPHGLIEAELRLGRAPYESLVTAGLAWKNPHLTPRDYEQIALHLTGRARAVAALPKNDGRGALAEVVLREAAGRLSTPIEGTVRCVQNRARLVRALYERLDRLTEPLPAAPWPQKGDRSTPQGLHTSVRCRCCSGPWRRTGVPIRRPHHLNVTSLETG